jgi:tetratricopeptide (TPR) repeat protein
MIKYNILIFLCFTPIWSVELIDDKSFKEKYEKAIKDAQDNPYALFSATGVCMSAREYQKGEDIILSLIKDHPVNRPIIYSNLSVFQGKLKKYDDAIKSADLALSLSPRDMHALAVKASWLYEKGEKDIGLKLFESIQVPIAGSFDESFYYLCKSCFFASVGDVEILKNTIIKFLSFRDNDAGLEFFRRDIVFDPYRDKLWFINLVGETLKE